MFFAASEVAEDCLDKNLRWIREGTKGETIISHGFLQTTVWFTSD